MPVGRGLNKVARVRYYRDSVKSMEQQIMNILAQVTEMNKRLDEVERILQRIALDVSKPSDVSLGANNASLGAMRLG